jgi:asparagine synthase (glutamine-hydrolysing)
MTDSPELLRNALEGAIRCAISGKDTAVAFSGGLDSGIVAFFVKEHAKSATLYTVGTESSHDIGEALSAAEELGMSLKIIPLTEDNVKEGLREMIHITGTKDPVVLSFELPLYFVCKYCSENDIIGGQGADELFAGYSKYSGLSKDALKKKTAEDLEKLRNITIPHEKKIAEHFGKRIHHPFLDQKVIEAADKMEDDIVPDDPAERKKALREVAVSIGLESISKKEKKAAQYSSGAMALIKRISKKNNVTYTELIEDLSKEAE